MAKRREEVVVKHAPSPDVSVGKAVRAIRSANKRDAGFYGLSARQSRGRESTPMEDGNRFNHVGGGVLSYSTMGKIELRGTLEEVGKMESALADLGLGEIYTGLAENYSQTRGELTGANA